MSEPFPERPFRDAEVTPADGDQDVSQEPGSIVENQVPDDDS